MLKTYLPYCKTERHRREGENATYFFSPRNKKYPKGSRPDRAVRVESNEKVGFWRANSKDWDVCFKDTVIGTKRNLVYFEGKPKINEKKTNWLMQEFMLDHAQRNNNAAATHENTVSIYFSSLSLSINIYIYISYNIVCT